MNSEPAPESMTSPSAIDTRRKAVLDMSGEDFREIGHTLVDSIADFLDSLPSRPVTMAETVDEIRRSIDADSTLPETGSEAAQIVRTTAQLLFDHSLFNGHPRFLGYVTSSPAPIGMLGDLLAAAINANVGAWKLSPVATEIEAQTVRWIADLIGYPTDCGGLFVSGGNMANLVGLLTARAARSGWDVRAVGMGSSRHRLAVYASTETHTWLQKATDMSGLGTDSIRWIPTDADRRMDATALVDAIARDHDAGIRPLLVVATAGTVSTGAVDPIFEISAICHDHGAWLHIDGAYGAFAATVPDAPADLRGLHLADSIAVDPHKWLYAPLEAGCTLVRDPEALRRAFSYHPPYYRFDDEATNYFDLGPQNSRGFRALKVWMALRHAGRTGYERMIADDIRLARDLYHAAADSPELEATTLGLSIATFRFIPLDLRRRIGQDHVDAYLDRLNESILARIQTSGEAFVSNAVLEGRTVLRACIVNFRTDINDVEALPGIVVRIGREEDATLRPESGPG